MRLRALPAWAVALSLICACAQGPINVLPDRTTVPAVTTSAPGATTPHLLSLNTSPGTADIEWDYGPGTYDFPDPASGLSDLASYTAVLSMTFAGTDAGQPAEWSR